MFIKLIIAIILMCSCAVKAQWTNPPSGETEIPGPSVESWRRHISQTTNAHGGILMSPTNTPVAGWALFWAADRPYWGLIDLTGRFSQEDGQTASNLASSAKADAGVVSGRVDIVVSNLGTASNLAALANSLAGSTSGRVDAVISNLSSASNLAASAKSTADAASSTNATQDGIIAGLSTNKYSQANGEAASNLASSAKADAGVVSGRVDIVVGNLTSVSNAAAQALSDAGTVSGRVDVVASNLGSVSGTVVTVSGNLTSVSNTASSAKTTADAALPKAGGTMSGTLNMAGNDITGIGTNTFLDGTMLFSTGGVLRVGSATNLDTVITSGNITSFEAPTPVYYADPATMKKQGTTFSVADWIPRNLVDLYAQYLVTAGATSRGLLDGPGYLFNDQNGLLVDQSTNYTWKNVGYDNYVAAVLGPVRSLFHLNGSDASTTFTDEISGVGLVRGNAQLDTVSNKFGTASLYLDGSASYMTLTNKAATVIGTNAFTLDFWINIPSLPTYRTLWGSRTSDAYNNTLIMMNGGEDGSGKLAFYSPRRSAGATDPWAGTSDPLPFNQWVHIAVVGNGKNDGARAFKVYVNGSLGIFFTNNYNLVTAASSWHFGYDGQYGGSYLTGWIDEIRLQHSEVWTENFTPPAVEGAIGDGGSPAATNTMSLVCTNKIVDFLPTATWMSILASGSGLTTNDVQGFVSPDYGTNWYQADLTPSASLDLSNTLFQGTAIYTNNVTSSNMTLKAVTTSNKVVKVLGMWGPSN